VLTCNHEFKITVAFTVTLVVCRDFRLSSWFCVIAVKISVLYLYCVEFQHLNGRYIRLYKKAVIGQRNRLMPL